METPTPNSSKGPQRRPSGLPSAPATTGSLRNSHSGSSGSHSGHAMRGSSSSRNSFASPDATLPHVPFSAAAVAAADHHSEWPSRSFGSGQGALQQSSSSSFASAPLIGPSSGDRSGAAGSSGPDNRAAATSVPVALADGNGSGAGGPSRPDGQADDGFNSNLSGASNVMVTVRVRPVLQTDQAKLSIVNVLDKKVRV